MANWDTDSLKKHFADMLNVVAEWPISRGKKELIKFYSGKPLSLKEAQIAHCCMCNGGYDGMANNDRDCDNPNCTLYQHFPYRKKPKTNKPKRKLTEDHKEKMQKGRKAKIKK